MNDGLLSKYVDLQTAAHFVGWAKLPHPCSRPLPASLQAKHSVPNNSVPPPVGHVTIVPLPNLQFKPTQNNACRLGKALACPTNQANACWIRRYRALAQQFHYQQNQQGFSLLEMTIVVFILSIIAAIALPNLAATDSMKLETAAKNVAAAIRFAQAESIRTKIPHGINTDATNNRIRVYSLPGLTPSYDIYNPIDKKLYDIQLNTDTLVAGVDLVSASFAFAGSYSSSTYLGFNTEGNPKYSVLFGNDYMLTSGTITLAYRGQQRIISIAPITGRVTIQ